MLFLSLLFGSIAAVFLWAFHEKTKLLDNNEYTDAQHGFSQAGVFVDYRGKTVSLNGAIVPVAAIRSIGWITPTDAHSIARIEVSDMTKPRHEIRFAYNEAESFCTRLTLAIERAGGPRFR